MMKKGGQLDVSRCLLCGEDSEQVMEAGVCDFVHMRGSKKMPQYSWTCMHACRRHGQRPASGLSDSKGNRDVPIPHVAPDHGM